MDGKKHFVIALTVCVVAAAVAANGQGKIIYVDGSANGPGNGSSWQSAYKYLQDALADAEAAAKPVEIRVGQGIYKPDRGAAVTPGDLEATFFVAPGTTLAGSYAGAGAPDPDMWDAELFPTILSGDLAGNDLPVAVPPQDRVTRDHYDSRWEDPTRTDNSFCIVRIGTADANLTTVVDGFTVTAAHSHDRGTYPDRKVAGLGTEEDARAIIQHCTFMLNTAPGVASDRANVTVLDCVFHDNTVRGPGGGMWVRGDSSLIARCLFQDNRAREGGGLFVSEGRFQIEDCTFVRNTACGLTCADTGFGGALYGSFSVKDSVVENCTFIDNRASWGGSMNFGSMGLAPPLPPRRAGPVLLRACRFAGNQAVDGGAIYAASFTVSVECSVLRANVALRHGGAVVNQFGEARLANCVFAGNRALEEGASVWAVGGGKRRWREMEAWQDFDVVLSNCTLTGNTAPVGRTLSCWSYESASVDTTTISNCILDNGGNEIGNRDGSQMTLTFTDLHGARAAVDDPCQAVVWGEGSIDADPCFARPGYWDPNGTADDPNDDLWVDGDYHLKSQAGRRDPNSEKWVLDDVTSPCIDAGDPNSPVGDEPLPNGGRINMGAYGGTAEASKSPEAGPASSLHVAYIFADDVEAAESFQSLLEEHGCSVSQVAVNEVTPAALASCDVVIAGSDSGYMSGWGDSQSVAAVADSGKPVIGLGEGGYALFGRLGLAIGYPEGGHAHDDGIYAVDPTDPLFKTPHLITIGEDRMLSLYAETEDVSIWLPSVPETIVPFGASWAASDHYPLVQEGGRYLLWGFVEPPASMTGTGRDLFINAVVLAASSAWEL